MWYVQEQAEGELQCWRSNSRIFVPNQYTAAFVGEGRGAGIGSVQEVAFGGSGFSSHYEKKWLACHSTRETTALPEETQLPGRRRTQTHGDTAQPASAFEEPIGGKQNSVRDSINKNGALS